MSKPLVSIIMPAYNAERYISEAIKSIIQQIYTNWELIIIEDCSTDKTYDEIMKHTDNRITVIRNQENKGIAYSTNIGLDRSKGKYIALLDDDDLALNNRLEVQVQYLERNKEIDVLGSRSIEVDENNELLTYCDIPKKNPKYIKAHLLFDMVNFTNSSLMIRRSLIERNNIRIHDNCYGIQDFCFYIDCSKVGNLTALEQPLIKHRIYATSTTKKMLRQKAQAREKIYAQTQKESMISSGFRLTDEEYSIINRVVNEQKVQRVDLTSLQNTMKHILEQAKSMNIDYYDELYIVCKKIFLKAVYHQDVFNLEINNERCRLEKNGHFIEYYHSGI